ncbi:MAG: cyclic GMP-AMP synthase DncV-like nucleotidyltransferase [Bacillota bacterium]
MGLQTYFEDFNKKIKMDYDELSELAEKRDIILRKLRADADLPSFEEFNQGSYAMFTGVEPLDKDYDIDVGLRFKVNKDEYDSLELKQKIHEILKDHTDYGAEIKKPCVTVKYKKKGEVAYHVDLAVYSYQDKDDTNSQMYLARGTNKENKEWEEADPIKLKDDIMDKWEDSKQRDQYRRIIRYMKRWKNLKFKSDGNSEPPGIGITLLAYEKFTPQKYDWLEDKYKFDDLEALITFVQQVKNMFVLTRYSQEKGEYLYKIEYFLPVKPKTNVFYKMTEIQMTEFKKKIEKLLGDLEEVKKESDIIEQCTKLNKIFGEDFPIPSKEDESRVQKNFVPPSSASGKGL